jgi:hypothetical protein
MFKIGNGKIKAYLINSDRQSGWVTPPPPPSFKLHIAWKIILLYVVIRLLDCLKLDILK